MSASALRNASSEGSLALDSRSHVGTSRRPVDLAHPVLICGVGRSGTSLLHSMLNAHPALALPPETHFFRRYVVPRRTRARIEQGTVADCARALESDSDLLRARVTPAEALEGERDGALDLARIYKRVLSCYAARLGKDRVGDKDPRNIDHLSTLAATFPHGHLLHVIRDPREVLLSRTRAAWSKDRPWWQHALLAEDQLRRGRELGARLFGARYIEVQYEALVADPAETLRGIARHVGLEYSEAMLDFRASSEALVDSSEREWKRETLGPLLVNNNEKWRNGLSTLQVGFVERVSREAFDRLGYRRSMASRTLAAAHGVQRRGPRFEAVAPVLRFAARAAFSMRRELEAGR